MTEVEERIERTLESRAERVSPDIRRLGTAVREGARRRRRRRVAAASVAAAIAVLAAGAVAFPWLSGDTPAPAGSPADTGPVLTLDEPMEHLPAARVRGTLRLVDGCLLLEDHDAMGATYRSVVAWPAGTTWRAATRTVVVDDANRYAVGDRVDGGGGNYDPTTDMTWLVGEDDAVAATRCARATDAEYIVIWFPPERY